MTCRTVKTTMLGSWVISWAVFITVSSFSILYLHFLSNCIQPSDALIHSLTPTHSLLLTYSLTHIPLFLLPTLTPLLLFPYFCSCTLNPYSHSLTLICLVPPFTSLSESYSYLLTLFLFSFCQSLIPIFFNHNSKLSN